MNKGIKSKPTFLFLLILTLILSSCSKGSSGPSLLTVELLSPGDGDTNVVLNPQIVVRFSVPVTGVSKSSVELSSGILSSVELGTITPMPNNTYIITVAGTLQSSTTYKLSLSDLIKSTQGVALEAVSYKFTTGFYSAPTVTMVTPFAGSTNIPVDSAFRFVFSASVSGVDMTSVTLHQGSVNGPAITSTVNGASLTDYTLVPATALSMDTTYYLDFDSSIIGVYGVPLIPTSFSFTTQAPLSVQMIQPYPTTSVALNANIKLVFSAPANGINTQSVTIYQGSPGGTQINFNNLTISPNRTTFIITLPILSSGTTYYLDIAGNKICDDNYNYIGAQQFVFSTLASSKPVAKLISPVTNAGVNSALQLQFNEPVTNVNSSSVTLLQGSPSGSPVSITFTSLDQALWNIAPQSKLASSTTYYLVLAGAAISDSQSNYVDASTFSLTTADTNGPTVQVTPADGEQNVSTIFLTPNISLQFNEPVTGVNTNSVILHDPTTGGNVSLTPYSNNSTYYSYYWNDPPYGVSAGTTYYLTLNETELDIVDSFGVYLQSKTFSFTTEPAPIATLQSPDPATNVPINTPIVLHFNKPVTGVNANNVRLLQGSTYYGFLSITGPDGQNNYTLTTPALKTSAAYTITLSKNIADIDGNALNPETLSFTTVSTPVVVNIFPDPSNFPVNSRIYLTFNQQVFNMDTQNVTLYQGTTNIPITLLTTDGINYQIIPSSFSPSTTYTLSLSSGVTNSYGLTLTPINYTIQTSPAGSTQDQPAVRMIQPDPTTNVALNSQIVVQFSEPVENVNTSNVALTGGGASIAQTDNATSYIITPAQALSPGQTYSLTLSAGITSLASNTPISSTTFQFSTALTQIDVSLASVQPIQLQLSAGCSCDGSNIVSLYENSTPVSVTLSQIGAYCVVSAPLQALTSYSIAVSGDVSCNGALSYISPRSFSFTTPPTYPTPAVKLVTPLDKNAFARETNGAPTITIQFDMPVTGVTTSSVTLTQLTTSTALSISLTAIDDTTYNITVLGGELPTQTVYTLALSSAIVSQNNVPLPATDFTLTTRPLSWMYIGGGESWRRYGYFGTQGVRDARNWPSSRGGSAYWTDSTGNLWVFGGVFLTNSTWHELNDLWRYEPPSQTYPSGVWTWMSGQSDQNPDQQNIINTAVGVFSVNNHPGGRDSAAFWITHNPDTLWMFGGSTPSQYLQDLWAYKISTDQWACMGGCNWSSGISNWGTKGVRNSSNWPFTRLGSAYWTDSTGNLWMFGGQDATPDQIGDVWRYELPSTSYPNGVWTWMGGTNQVNTDNSYGSLQVKNTSNLIGCRSRMMDWQDSTGNIWIFGGYGANGWTLYDNDMWRYEITNNSAPADMWTWMSGDQNPTNSSFPLGTQDGTPFQVPGDSNDLWLYGGNQAMSESGYANQFMINNVLKYNMNTYTWSVVRNCPANPSSIPDPSTKGIFNPLLCPMSNWDPQISFVDGAGNFWVMTSGTQNYDASGHTYADVLYKFETH
jgi:hypothetical protein